MVLARLATRSSVSMERFRMPKHPEVEGHWHSQIENFSTSTLDFYELVKAGLSHRGIPDLKIKSVEWKEGGLGSGRRVYLRISREHLNFDICAAPFGTGFFFSWWLARISQGLLDVAFLAGVLFVSGGIAQLQKAEMEAQMPQYAWAFSFPFIFLALLFALGILTRYGNLGLEPTVLSMPITGWLYGFVFRPVTYFNEDTALMFRGSVHQAVLEAIDQVTSMQGARSLSDAERQMPAAAPKAKIPDLHVHLT
jgi:hypothetical protein